MIYLDTSAILKRFVVEPESEALQVWLAARPEEHLMSSGLLRVELHRTLARLYVEHSVHELADQLLGELYLHPVDAVLQRAATLDGDLRSLDALHLATALTADPPPTLVTYDQRLADAATRAGLNVATPTDSTIGQS